MKKLNAKRLAALAMTLVMLLGVLTACGDKADTNNGSGDGEGVPDVEGFGVSPDGKHIWWVQTVRTAHHR